MPGEASGTMLTGTFRRPRVMSLSNVVAALSHALRGTMDRLQPASSEDSSEDRQ